MSVVCVFFFLISVAWSDLFVHPSGSGSCTESSKCTVEDALKKLHGNCDSETINFDSGVYRISGISTSLPCSSLSIVGKAASPPVLLLEGEYHALFTFTNDVSVSISQIFFKEVNRTIMTTSTNKLDLSLTSVNFSAGILPLINDSYKVASISMKSVFVENWKNGFILIRDNEIACKIDIQNVKFRDLENTCPLQIESDIYNSKTIVTATITDFSVENSKSIFHPSSGIGIISHTIAVTLSKCTMKNGFYGGVHLRSLYDLTLNIRDVSTFENILGIVNGGAIVVQSYWGKVNVDIENSFFQGNAAYLEGGAIAVISNQSVTFSSKNSRYKNNECGSGYQHRGGGSVCILQNDLFQPGKSTIKITGDHYEKCHTGKSYGGVYWMSLNNYDLTVSGSHFHDNQGGFPGLEAGYMNGGVFYLGSWKSIGLKILDSEFVRNTGQEGGVVFMANFNTTNSITVERSNFTENRAFDTDCEQICQTGRGGVFFFQLMQLSVVEDPAVSFVLKNNTFVKNSAVWDGGLFYLTEDTKASWYDVEMTGNVFEGNSAWGSGGTGYMVQSNGVLRSNRFIGNVGGAGIGRYQARGGGLSWKTGKSLLFGEGNVFDGNSANQNGGAISVTGVDSFTVLNGNTIKNNHAEGGGGIYIENVGSTELHSLIQNNRATYGGGLVLSLSDTDQFTLSNKVTKNTAQYGGGIYVVSGNPQNMKNLDQFVTDNTLGNLMSNPTTIRKIKSATENTCSIGGKNDLWWNCRIFDLQFLDMFGDILIENTLTSFTLSLVFPGFGAIPVTTDETLGFSFSFLPQISAFQTDEIHGHYDAEVWFNGIKVTEIEIFFDNGKTPEEKSYLWVLYMCLIIFVCCVYFCCLCCLTCLVFVRLLVRVRKSIEENKYGYQQIINEDEGTRGGGGMTEENVNLLMRDETPSPVKKTEEEGEQVIQIDGEGKKEGYQQL